MVIAIVAKVLIIYLFFGSHRQDNVLNLQNHATVYCN